MIEKGNTMSVEKRKYKLLWINPSFHSFFLFYIFPFLPVSPFFIPTSPLSQSIISFFPSTLLFFTYSSTVTSTSISLYISLHFICFFSAQFALCNPFISFLLLELKHSFPVWSILSTFLISSVFLTTFYTSLHLNPSCWSILLHPLTLFLRSMAVYRLPGKAFFAASWHRNSCWQDISSVQ